MNSTTPKGPWPSMHPAELPSVALLRGLAVRLSGMRRQDRVPDYDWKGQLLSTEAIVAVVFLTTAGRTEWIKSEPGCGWLLPVDLACPRYDRTGLDVQVCATVGAAQRRTRTLLAAPIASDPMPESMEFESGVVSRLVRIEGLPPVEWNVLVLAERLVKTGRAHLWALRSRHEEEVPEPLRGILMRGRTGIFGSSPVGLG